MNNKKLMDEILKLRFDEINGEFRQLSIEGQKDLLTTIAFDTESILVLAFVLYLLNRYESEEYINILVDLLVGPFSYLEGAYALACHYNRKLLNGDKQKIALDRMIFFHDLPEKLVSDNEAQYYKGLLEDGM